MEFTKATAKQIYSSKQEKGRVESMAEAQRKKEREQENTDRKKEREKEREEEKGVDARAN